MSDNNEYGVLIFVIGIMIGMVVGIWLASIKSMDKDKCYEIYATDNVVLKQCQVYFEEDK